MENPDKKYYKISEVAEIIKLPASTLRFWESQFTIIKPRRNARGTRFYTASDIEKIRMVAFLVKEKGLRLDAAQEQIRNNHTNVSHRAAAVERLHNIRTQLVSLLSSLTSLRWRDRAIAAASSHQENDKRVYQNAGFGTPLLILQNRSL